MLHFTQFAKMVFGSLKVLSLSLNFGQHWFRFWSVPNNEHIKSTVLAKAIKILFTTRYLNNLLLLSSGGVSKHANQLFFDSFTLTPTGKLNKTSCWLTLLYSIFGSSLFTRLRSLFTGRE